MQEQGRNPIEYVSSLRVICSMVLFPTMSGEYMLVLFEENWFGKNSTCAVYPEDRSTCSLNSDAEVTTLKWVGQSHASRRNMLSPCKIAFPLEKNESYLLQPSMFAVGDS